MLNEEEETLNKQWNEIKSSENDRGENGVVLCCVAIWISCLCINNTHHLKWATR